ncbi:uncharacterized protein LOC119664268 [Teleopsis dalmanni]|uniref:uncharacterized protein LOC119664268 n=1 Tax=Teleopsis dalmanni TaxID=139649 RepID=UPI0018CD0D95|nr:uncharacterized protein LOC119664268 [Teleopsis dalmanni]
MFNVFAFIGDSSYKSEFYTFWAYPNFHIVKESVNALADYFPNKFKNLYGTSIITLPDQLEPRTIVHRNKLGQQVLTGYVGKFMLTLAWKLNATLKYARPVKGGEIIFYGDLLASTKNGTLDMPASILPITNLTILRYKRKHYQCHIFEFILNDVTLRGLLGQTFNMLPNANITLKLVYILLSLSGLYISSHLQAYLQTMLTQPPKERQLMTFKDASEAKLPILVSEEELIFYTSTQNLYSEYSLHFVSTSYADFHQKRNDLFVKYAYPIPNILWMVYEQQQKFFLRKLFVFSWEACFMSTTYYGFTLQKHSLYRPAVENLILDVRAYGLIDNWFHANFYDMVMADRVSFTDKSNPKVYGGSLKIEDLQWVWITYILLIILSIWIFTVEFFIAHFIINK